VKQNRVSARRRAPRADDAQREQVLAAFDRSGLSAADFARRHDIHYTTFCSWRRRRDQVKASPAFVQVELDSAGPPSELVIEMGAARLRLTSAAQIPLAAQLLRALQRRTAVLSFHAHLKVFLASAPCDLRMNFNGLWAAAQERLGEDPKGGALFVFGNRRHNRIRILYFEGTGVCILSKRLEEGTFHWPRSAGEPGAKIRLAPQALQLLLDGVDLKDGARRAWYESSK
jgi:transposase